MKGPIHVVRNQGHQVIEQYGEDFPSGNGEGPHGSGALGPVGDASPCGCVDEAGNEAALTALATTYRASYEGLHKRALRIVGSCGAADDVVQRAFLCAAHSIEAGREIKDPGLYLRRCVYRLAVVHVQRDAILSVHGYPAGDGDISSDEMMSELLGGTRTPKRHGLGRDAALLIAAPSVFWQTLPFKIQPIRVGHVAETLINHAIAAALKLEAKVQSIFAGHLDAVVANVSVASVPAMAAVTFAAAVAVNNPHAVVEHGFQAAASGQAATVQAGAKVTGVGLDSGSVPRLSVLKDKNDPAVSDTLDSARMPDPVDPGAVTLAGGADASGSAGTLLPPGLEALVPGGDPQTPGADTPTADGKIKAGEDSPDPDDTDPAASKSSLDGAPDRGDTAEGNRYDNGFEGNNQEIATYEGDYETTLDSNGYDSLDSNSYDNMLNGNNYDITTYESNYEMTVQIDYWVDGAEDSPVYDEAPVDQEASPANVESSPALEESSPAPEGNAPGPDGGAEQPFTSAEPLPVSP